MAVLVIISDYFSGITSVKILKYSIQSYADVRVFFITARIRLLRIWHLTSIKMIDMNTQNYREFVYCGNVSASITDDCMALLIKMA